MTLTRVLTSVVTSAAIVVLVAGGLLVVGAPSGSNAVWYAGFAMVALAAVLAGVVVSLREPANIVALLLASIGLIVAHAAVRDVYWHAVAQSPGALPVPGDVVVAGLRQATVWGVVAMGALLLVFPDGRLPTPRWRLAAIVLVSSAALFQAVAIFDPSDGRPGSAEPPAVPFGILPEPVLLPLTVLALFGLMAATVACAWSLVGRYRTSDSLRRAQLRWLAIAGIALPLWLVACGAEVALTGGPGWFSFAALLLVLVGIPAATAVAIVRHDLYDVDRALSATVTYGLLSAALLVVYASASLVAGVALGRDSAVAAAAITALCAVALAPLRRQLTAAVDRRLYPRRGAALAAIRDLEQRIHAGSGSPENLVDVLRDALRDPALRIAYTLPGHSAHTDALSSTIESPHSVPVVLGGSRIGEVIPGTPATSPALLREVATAGASLVEMVRLRLELNAALHEVEASRARLVQMGDRERRRLQRDLHDGAQQRLVALGMSLRVAQRHLSDGSVDVGELLDRSVAQLTMAVAELRQLAHGLRPSALDDGLRAALSSLTVDLPVSVDLDVQVERLPDEVEITAYYVATEALANAIKHAAASRVEVAVVADRGQVAVRVRDDGCGGAVVREGSGLSGLADRVAAIGGRVAVHSPGGSGTLIEASLPCAW